MKLISGGMLIILCVRSYFDLCIEYQPSNSIILEFQNKKKDNHFPSFYYINYQHIALWFKHILIVYCVHITNILRELCIAMLVYKRDLEESRMTHVNLYSS